MIITKYTRNSSNCLQLSIMIFLTVKYHGTARNSFFASTNQRTGSAGRMGSFSQEYVWLVVANWNKSSQHSFKLRNFILFTCYICLQALSSCQFPCTSTSELSAPLLNKQAGYTFPLFHKVVLGLIISGGVILSWFGG